MRLVALVALLATLSGCSSTPPITAIDGPTCVRGVTRTFWLPCDKDREIWT